MRNLLTRLFSDQEARIEADFWKEKCEEARSELNHTQALLNETIKAYERLKENLDIANQALADATDRFDDKVKHVTSNIQSELEVRSQIMDKLEENNLALKDEIEDLNLKNLALKADMENLKRKNKMLVEALIGFNTNDYLPLR